MSAATGSGGRVPMAAMVPGMAIPALHLPPLDQATLARYAEASGDHAPVHLDAGYARAMGFPGVIAHGLLVMAWLGRALTGWQEQRRLRAFSCRFVAVTLLDDALRCSGTIRALRDVDAERLADVDLLVCDQHGEVKIRGLATLVLDFTKPE